MTGAVTDAKVSAADEAVAHAMRPKIILDSAKEAYKVIS